MYKGWGCLGLFARGCPAYPQQSHQTTMPCFRHLYKSTLARNLVAVQLQAMSAATTTTTISSHLLLIAVVLLMVAVEAA